MSNYTPKMEAELREKDEWTFADCEAYAENYPEISARSVASKVKSMDLTYIPKPKAATKSGAPVIRKSDIVRAFAASIGANYDAISGLAKADKASLLNLIQAVNSPAEDS